MWNFFCRKKSQTHPDITVEIRIITLINERYVNAIFEISAPKGSTLKHLLKAAKQQGNIDKDVYGFIHNLKPPISLILNGTPIEDRIRKKRLLSNGDKITIFTPVSGG